MDSKSKKKKKTADEEEKPFWEKQDYIRYLLKSNIPGPKLFRAKQMVLNKSGAEEEEEEHEDKKSEKSPLELLRETQDNIEFQFKMYGTELSLYPKEGEETKKPKKKSQDDEAEMAGFLNQELLAYEKYLEGKKAEAIHRNDFSNLLTTAAIDVTNKIESLKVASSWLESLGIDVADPECTAPFSNKADRKMDLRHTADEALTTEVRASFDTLEMLVHQVSGLGVYIIKTYFGWPGGFYGARMPPDMLKQFQDFDLKTTSQPWKSIVKLPTPAAAKEGTGEDSASASAGGSLGGSSKGEGSSLRAESLGSERKVKERISAVPFPADFVIEDLKTFHEAVDILDELYDRALMESRGKLIPILLNRTKAQLLFCIQSCEKRIEEMAAAVRNIMYHRQTIERIRRDIAVINAEYLPAQEPIFHKRQNDIAMSIKMAKALDEKMEMLASKMETFDRQYKLLFEDFNKNLMASLNPENLVSEARGNVETAKDHMERHARMFKSASQQSFFLEVQPRKSGKIGKRK